MKDRPIVSSQTVNLDHLRSLKRGTLGREYVEWLQRGDLSPDSREKVSPNELQIESKLIFRSDTLTRQLSHTPCSDTAKHTTCIIPYSPFPLH
jgi:hypothetical protein